MLLSPLGIAVTNVGTVVAEEVVLTLEFDAANLVAVGETDVPKKPSTHLIRPVEPVRFPDPVRVAVRQFADRYEVRASIGDVQPGTTAWTLEPFYVGAREEISIPVAATVSANNLGIPKTSTVEISVNPVSRKISTEDIVFFED